VWHLQEQGAELRVRLEEEDFAAAPWLIIPDSLAASAVLPALASWDVAPSAMGMQVTLHSHIVTLTTVAGDVTATCQLQVSNAK
jgi:hypothetical protein